MSLMTVRKAAFVELLEFLFV